MENEKHTYIVRTGEVALKGMNKPYFEKVLLGRIKNALKDYKNVEAYRKEGLIFVKTPAEYPEEEVEHTILNVFGVASLSSAVETESDMEKIGEAAAEYMKKLIPQRNIKTFKVEAKRADKSFPVQSPEIASRIGGYVLKANDGQIRVDVHNPDCVLYVNVRHGHSYVFADKIRGFGGLPLGTNGRGLILLSGGIDSPVAAWMMAKRGMMIEAVHFHSYPYTSERAREKVYDLTGILAGYCGTIKVHSINLLSIQQAIGENCPEDEMTILSRRFMMMIAERVAKQNKCDMLITGESIGQVASQTVQGLVATDNAVDIPVMRPLIAMDKIDIIDRARKIGTYETSIEPYEDCCTVFLPKHPVTKPKLEKILESESKLDVEALIDEAMKTMETVSIGPDRI
ncbi:MAG: tRNA uracil 4-sulfurtransferase ThiI [Anaerovoracaceae bacterium]|nr:tRNA 4-thiouridine(8) synthase ThiI [Bacillota bacterium]MDY2670315.1 tRNA uracil 4-sulfurtransferase ThiI [Anaerovoracaceae bacterium]